MVKLVVDGKEIVAPEGQSLLQTCLENGIFIPNLCFLKEMETPPASCRLCFVEIAGGKKPVPSCAVKTRAGLEVRTDTPPVRRLQRAAFRLLRSAHRLGCRHCAANRRCPLQHLARFLSVPLKPKRLDHIVRDLEVQPAHPFLAYDPSRCVLCGKCVYVCGKSHDHGLLTFAKRGFATIITAFGENERRFEQCRECHACVDICPVAAIFFKDYHPARIPCGE